MGRIKNYKLSNGKSYTVNELIELTGISRATIVSRLWKTKDYDVITAPICKSQQNAILHFLSDGTRKTVKQLSKDLNVPEISLRKKLKETNNIEELSKLTKSKKQDKIADNYIPPWSYKHPANLCLTRQSV
jgi:DeoR/GlpR family transcriptional regulator of sugar metabolism